MSEQPLGVGIVGAGGIALAHMAALRSTPTAELVAVCDQDVARAEEVAHGERCASYGDVASMLTDPRVEAVIVCTPNATHASLGRQILESDRHLLMEKPLALSVEEAQRLADLAHERGSALAVGHSHRFSDQGRAIHDVIASGAIGTPRFVRIVITGGWIWPGWQAWVLNPEQSGGHSLHNGVHLTDLACWWVGERAESVFSTGQKATSAALDIHDYLVTELTFPSGAVAICEVSRGERPRAASYFEVTVIGTEGVVSREWEAEGLLAWTDTGLAAWGVDGAAHRTFVHEIEAFAASARGGAPVVPPIDDAVHAVEVGVASETSLRGQHTVRLDGRTHA